MDLEAFHRLLTPLGQSALQAAMALSPKEADFLADFQALSRQFPPDLARSALEIAILRAEAVPRFPYADQLYFTRPALEQATSYDVAQYRAGRYAPFSLIADLGCSIGGDLLALAALPDQPLVTGIDQDTLRLRMAQANLQATGPFANVHLLHADLSTPLPLEAHSKTCALFFDPARRSDSRRLFHVNDYQPPLSVIENWLPSFHALGVKVSPGVDLSQLTGYDAEIEFISLRGELKEAVLWFGLLRTASRRATILPDRNTLSGSPDVDRDLRPNLCDPLAWLLEPDPAVLRAGLVRMLAEQLGAAQLDPDIAYLTASQHIETPFARTWAIVDWFPFQLKRLRAYLRLRGIGRLTVKKRGSPIEPADLIRDLRLSGDAEGTLALTHLRGEPIVIILSPSSKQ